MTGLVLGALAGGPATGQVADLSRATCAQLLELPRGERGQLVIWLDGYFAGAAGRASLDRRRLEESLTSVQAACERNPALPLVGAETRDVFLGAAARPPEPPQIASPPAAPPSAPSGQAPARPTPVPAR